MPLTPEQYACQQIEAQLEAAGWVVQDARSQNLAAGQGIAVREFSPGQGYGEADYLLFGNRRALGVIEAKKEGETLTGVEIQAEKYSVSFPATLRAWYRPLPFLYQSTGVETRFTNALDPDARSRSVFAFHRPETLIAWVKRTAVGETSRGGVVEPEKSYPAIKTPLWRLREMPPLDPRGMRPPQITAIENLETSLCENRPRALVQMATGSGKTYTAVALLYRLIKYGGFKRAVFLVDRSNLGEQALREFQQYTTPDDGRKFTELYNVQHLQSNRIDPVCRVVITTIQRLFSILKGQPEFDPENEEKSAAYLLSSPVSVGYNPDVPIEMFDLVITDECHRSIYNLWRQVLEYFDAYLIGLTATPSKQTFGFFNQNLVMEYNHAMAVADGVNVDFDIYRIKTKVTEEGATVEAGVFVDKRNRRSRKVRWEALEEDLTYLPSELDRAVVTEDQIRTVIRTFKERLFTEIFPGRSDVPKTLIFAKDDSHAEDIVRIAREEFGKGNAFCEKITYRTGYARIVDEKTGETIGHQRTGSDPKAHLASFRNSYNPRIAVTVDMIATGTDVKPLEIVFFMRDVKSANYFEQMKGRGSRVILTDDFQAVTPDAKAKTRFVIVDAVGVTERDLAESPSLERQPAVPFAKVLQAVAQGSTEPDVVSTLASRLSRLERALSDTQKAALAAKAGKPLPQLIRELVEATDPDVLEKRAGEKFGTDAPSEAQIEEMGDEAREDAVTPFLDPELRELILDIQRDNEQIIDRVTKDEIIDAGYDERAKEQARKKTASFAEYLKEHQDEITALQLLYSRRRGQSPTLKQLKELAEIIKRPPNGWIAEDLWTAYEALERSRVRGSGSVRVVADLVSLVRFTLEQETILAPYAEVVNDRFERWLADQNAVGAEFTPEQKGWLILIRDQIASSLSVEADDFDYVPFSERGGLGKAYQLFGERFPRLLKELNEVLAA